jgi:hypothetical protein
MSSDHYADLLQSLYDSEIHFQIRAVWDGGFDWTVGLNSKLEGYAEGNARTFKEAVQQLTQTAIQKYPDSLFALGPEKYAERKRQRGPERN